MKPKDDLEKGIKATAKSLVDFSLQKMFKDSKGSLVSTTTSFLPLLPLSK